MDETQRKSIEKMIAGGQIHQLRMLIHQVYGEIQYLNGKNYIQDPQWRNPQKQDAVGLEILSTISRIIVEKNAGDLLEKLIRVYAEQTQGNGTVNIADLPAGKWANILDLAEEQDMQILAALIKEKKGTRARPYAPMLLRDQDAKDSLEAWLERNEDTKKMPDPQDAQVDEFCGYVRSLCYQDDPEIRALGADVFIALIACAANQYEIDKSNFWMGSILEDYIGEVSLSQGHLDILENLQQELLREERYEYVRIVDNLRKTSQADVSNPSPQQTSGRSAPDHYGPQMM